MQGRRVTSVKCSAEFRTEGDYNQITADRAFTDWVRNLPATAVLSPISMDKGNQRDPWPILVGLRAEWDEER